MTKVRALAAVAVWTAALTSGTAGTARLPQSPTHAHTAMTPAEFKWGAASPALPAGATSAVIYGDPSKEGQPFVFRVKLPDGYRIAPHWHPTDEHVTVLQGTFLMGMGEKFEKGALKSLGVGAYAHTTAKTPTLR